MLMLGAAGGLSGFPLPIQATVALSPAVQVKGQVVDENGQPLIGATVKEKGGKSGTVTDLDGNFVLNVDGTATLVISYVGYNDREVAIRNRAILDLSNWSPIPCRSTRW